MMILNEPTTRTHRLSLTTTFIQLTGSVPRWKRHNRCTRNSWQFTPTPRTNFMRQFNRAPTSQHRKIKKSQVSATSQESIETFATRHHNT